MASVSPALFIWFAGQYVGFLHELENSLLQYFDPPLHCHWANRKILSGCPIRNIAFGEWFIARTDSSTSWTSVWVVALPAEIFTFLVLLQLTLSVKRSLEFLSLTVKEPKKPNTSGWSKLRWEEVQLTAHNLFGTTSKDLVSDQPLFDKLFLYIHTVWS